MTAPAIGRTVRRLRLDANLTQAALAQTLGISASYLNLIEHDQRAITASLLLKLAAALGVELAQLSGHAERQAEVLLREALADPHLGQEAVPEAEIAALAATPRASAAVLALYRAWRIAREDASGIALPSGRRLLLPQEEARDVFAEHGNHFPLLEEAAEGIGHDLAASPAEMNHAIAERLRRRHGLAITVGPLPGALRRYDPLRRALDLSETLARESRGFHLAVQLALLEAHAALDATMAPLEPSTPEAAGLIRLGLVNYLAAAILMPYPAYRAAAAELRHDIDALAARFGVSFEQAAQRLASLQRPGARGIPFFFLRTDPAGNTSKRFSAAGFPFARYGGSCPRWVVHAALGTPGRIAVQVAALPDGATFLCVARAIVRPGPWGEPPPVHIVAVGCDAAHAGAVVYADGIDLPRATVGIGLSCRLCDRADCRSRAFAPLAHRLALDPNTAGASPYRFTR